MIQAHHAQYHRAKPPQESCKGYESYSYNVDRIEHNRAHENNCNWGPAMAMTGNSAGCRGAPAVRWPAPPQRPDASLAASDHWHVGELPPLGPAAVVHCHVGLVRTQLLGRQQQAAAGIGGGQGGAPCRATTQAGKQSSASKRQADYTQTITSFSHAGGGSGAAGESHWLVQIHTSRLEGRRQLLRSLHPAWAEQSSGGSTGREVRCASGVKRLGGALAGHSKGIWQVQP